MAASAYSPEQIESFLGLIGLLPKYALANSPAPDLALLTAVQVHMLSTIPYDNLLLHYSPQHTVSLDLAVLYDKFVGGGRRGRGGYCMENSLFLNHILRGLGFDVYTVGVKIRRRLPNGVPFGPYVGWVHIVNIITLADGTRYVVDVGFGGDGPTKPLPLIDGNVVQNMGTQEVRLVRDHIPIQTKRTPETRMWIYQYRNSLEQEWNSFYAFYDVEFTEADFGVMNWFTGNSPVSPQHDAVLVTRFLRRAVAGATGEDYARQEIYGKQMLVGGTYKENHGGKTSVISVSETEAERLQVLQEKFGISFLEDERDAIRGLRSALRMT